MNILSQPNPGHEQVFHVTSPNDVQDILATGLVPNPNRHIYESSKLTEKLLDNVRPEKVKKMNISRAQGVFAHPYIESVRPYSMGAYRVAEGLTPAILCVDVEPEAVLVCDAWTFDDIQNEIEIGIAGGLVRTTREAEAEALKYWDGAMTLVDFKRYYTPVHNPQFASNYARNDFAPEDLPDDIMIPEVIIPGPIEPGQIEWAGSVLKPLYRYQF